MTHPATPIDSPQIAPVQLAGSNVEFELDLSFVSSFYSAFTDVQGILCHITKMHISSLPLMLHV